MTTTAEQSLRRVLDLTDWPTSPAEWLLGQGFLDPEETVQRAVPGTGAWHVRNRDLLIADLRVLLVTENIVHRGYTVAVDDPLSEVTGVGHRGFLVTWFTVRRRGRNLRVWHPEDADAETAQAVNGLLTTGTPPAPLPTKGSGALGGTGGAESCTEVSFWAATGQLGTRMQGSDPDVLPAKVLYSEETVVRIIAGASGGEDSWPLLIVTDGRGVPAAKDRALSRVVRVV